MGKILLLCATVVFSNLPLYFWDNKDKSAMESIILSFKDNAQTFAIERVKFLLHTEAPTLRKAVVNKVAIAIVCASTRQVEHNGILSVIDYSLPSNEKRLWVFSLKDKKLLFHTYVAHGIKSGVLLTNYFSNKYNSKASSIGVYKTGKAYYGREGLSLRLDGLERSFNDNASNRAIVMHGGWYVEEKFIKKYGRPGRSWGCPALPLTWYKSIINTIKDQSLFVVYYPSDDWLNQSRFLHCENNTDKTLGIKIPVNPMETEIREPVLLTNLHKGEEGTAVVAMSADNYAHIFHTVPPLERMLRRQIEEREYIALSANEFSRLAEQAIKNPSAGVLNTVLFISPYIIMVRGYHETQMKILPFGPIHHVQWVNAPSNMATVYFKSNKILSVRPTHEFIRWVGL